MENSKNEYWNDPQPVRQDNKKLAAGLLAIILAPFGVHKFLLGYTSEGIIWLVISLFTCGILTGLLGIIEGIIYLTKSDEEFYNTYQLNKRGWF
jgi:TM2 domain-containing membrane protein YozV